LLAILKSLSAGPANFWQDIINFIRLLVHLIPEGNQTASYGDFIMLGHGNEVSL
jgi:hypothetical protein